MKPISYYLENTTETMNGVVFKDYDAFENNPDEPCYISEYGLMSVRELYNDNPNITVQELIDAGQIETYNTILASVMKNLDELRDAEEDENKPPHELACIVFEESDWTYISTTILQLTY